MDRQENSYLCAVDYYNIHGRQIGVFCYIGKFIIKTI